MKHLSNENVKPLKEKTIRVESEKTFHVHELVEITLWKWLFYQKPFTDWLQSQ